jgi:hypothetical protein
MLFSGINYATHFLALSGRSCAATCTMSKPPGSSASCSSAP